MHKSMNLLTCHYCGYTYRIPTVCPACGGTDLRGRGFGTEKVEEYVGQVFPEARVARMDLDTTRTRNANGRIIDDFSSGRTNLLIGTQMVSKGLDFDRVSVVGILNADAMLNYPDFRAYEHAFMMMAQVSGRAGRKGQRGKVFLQTKNKELPIIRQVVENDYQGFYKALLEERKLFSYPPFHRLVYVFLRHRHDDVVETADIEMGSRLRQGLVRVVSLKVCNSSFLSLYFHCYFILFFPVFELIYSPFICRLCFFHRHGCQEEDDGLL